MTISLRKFFALLALFLMSSFAIAEQSFAQLIAADSFNNADYPATTGLNGQDPNIAPGWEDPNRANRPWNVGSANIQSDIGGSLSNGSVTYDDASDGQGRYVANSFDFYRAGSRAIDAYTPADTYYMSVLYNTGGNFSNNTGAEQGVVGFTNFFDSGAFRNGASAFTPYGVMMGMSGTADTDPNVGVKDLIIRARDNVTGDMADTTILADAAFNTTYLIVAKLDINVGGGATDIVDYWVNPTDLTSDAAMTSSALSNGSIDTFAMDQNDRIDRFHVISDTWSSSFFWDEPRFGYDLSSVAGALPVTDDPDFNGNDFIDAPDFLIWQRNAGATGATQPDGDANGDGNVDGADLAIWDAQYGTAQAISAVSAVPEPTTALIFLMSTLCIVGRRSVRV